MKHTYSIKQKLVVHLMALFFSTWLCVTLAELYADYRAFQQDYQQSVTTHVQELLIEWANYRAFPADEFNLFSGFADLEQDFERVQIYQHQKRVFSSHPQSPAIPISQSGFFRLHGQPYYVYQSPSNLTMAVQLFDDGTNDFFELTFFRQLLPFLLLLPLVGYGVFLIVGRALAPLDSLRQHLSNQSPKLLTDIPLKGSPVEVIPLLQAFNDLVRRLNATFEKEQRFSANAAHELLTPLAAIKSETQLFQQGFKGLCNQPDLQPLTEISARVDRATHTIRQMLLLTRYSRSERDGAPTELEPTQAVDVSALCQQILSEMGNLIESKHINLQFEDQTSQPIASHPDALNILVRNLIDNAVRYCPPEGSIALKICHREQGVEINIGNSCNSFSHLVKERLTEPFVRGPGETSTGSGIGLALTQQIAMYVGGEMDIEITETRFEVSVTLPDLITEAAEACLTAPRESPQRQ